ncbi:RHNO1 protein, partial [Chordeiles acutipennis]|nr:RHNO1 protein [Chordeiles acutipennis]
MPLKKKCTHKARKSELVFLEKPREGSVHCYETPLRSAKNPRRVPTKPVDQHTSAAWVCPQFETTKLVVFKACPNKHRDPHKPQNRDTNHSLLHAGGASRRASKFPPLTFENPEGYAVHPSDSPSCSRKNTQCCHSPPEKRGAAKANTQVNSPGNCGERPLPPARQAAQPQGFSPPHAETAQAPSIGNRPCGGALPRTQAWHPEEEGASGAGPCGGGEAAAVLVPDTPEQEYGVRVTWRRRPRLMRYLRERG